jgi:hypothetical protein
VSAGLLVWPAPVLVGARLISLSTLGPDLSVVRVCSPHYGHVDLVGERVVIEDARAVMLEPGEVGIGPIADVIEQDDAVLLVGEFGTLRMQANPVAEFTDRWWGTIAADVALAESSVPAERLLGSVLDDGDVQVTIVRVTLDGRAMKVVLCAGGDHAVSVRLDPNDDLAPQDAVIFHRDDLTMRMLEHAALLRGPTNPGEPPIDGLVTGQVKVQIARRHASGSITGAVETWLEAGATGWVHLLVDPDSDDEPTDRPIGSDQTAPVYEPRAIGDLMEQLVLYVVGEEQ